MESRLTHVKTWEAIAVECRYSVSLVARRFGMSVRQVERFTDEAFGRPPHLWLRTMRLQRAVLLLREGRSAKATAIELGYRDPAHFTHDFKKEFGICPQSQCCGAAPAADPGRDVAF